MNKKQVIISGAVLLVLAVVVFIVGFSLGRSGGENDSKDKAGDDKKVVTEKVEKDKDLTEDSEDDKNSSEETENPSEEVKVKKKKTGAVSKLDTGNLSETGDGYEGTKGTGKFNYGDALQKSLIFYELQRSGDLPE